MRILLLAILLVGAPFMAAETEPETQSDSGNPEKATGPLSQLEAKLQGTWKPGYTITFEGREFCADTQPGEWYEGYIVIRPDEEPAQFDFVIEKCKCGFQGSTSSGIFRLDGDTLVVVSAVPGNARPQAFEKNAQWVTMRFKGDESSETPGEHCSTWSAKAK